MDSTVWIYILFIGKKEELEKIAVLHLKYIKPLVKQAAFLRLFYDLLPIYMY